MTPQALQAVLFYVLALLTAVSAVAVVVSQNIVRAATWLLFALAGTAGIYFLLGAEFVGATQLLIYVGGTLVLVVFGVMLTAQGPFVRMKIGLAEWAIALAVGLLFYGVLAVSLNDFRVEEAKVEQRVRPRGEENNLTSSKHLGAAMLGDTNVTPGGKLTGLEGMQEQDTPDRKKMGYLLPFEIVSVHLLVVLIGAAYLARAKRKVAAANNP